MHLKNLSAIIAFKIRQAKVTINIYYDCGGEKGYRKLKSLVIA